MAGLSYLPLAGPGAKQAVTICHCTDCQTLSGTAFRVVVPAKAGSFRLLAGELKGYVRTAESGNPRLQTFCPECGTPIYSAPGAQPPLFLRIGAIKQRVQLQPRTQIWSRSAQRWLGSLGSVPRLERQDWQVLVLAGRYGACADAIPFPPAKA